MSLPHLLVFLICAALSMAASCQKKSPAAKATAQTATPPRAQAPQSLQPADDMVEAPVQLPVAELGDQARLAELEEGAKALGAPELEAPTVREAAPAQARRRVAKKSPRRAKPAQPLSQAPQEEAADLAGVGTLSVSGEAQGGGFGSGSGARGLGGLASSSRRSSRGSGERYPASRTPASVGTTHAAVEAPRLQAKGAPHAPMIFKHYGVNPTVDTRHQASSTFGIDVDTASYGIAQSYLNRHQLPPADSVRVEEFVNALDYGYAAPRDGQPFRLFAESVPSPSREGFHLLHLGIQAKRISMADRKPAKLVFVIDTSGSMDMGNRMGLVKQALRTLLTQLNGQDEVGIIAYNQRAKEILPLTSVRQRRRILSSLSALRPGGSTNAGEGLQLGYEMASRGFKEGFINRVVLCSDGVANTGLKTGGDIRKSIEDFAAKGITLTSVGVGMGNYNDVLLEELADKGDGNYTYLKDARSIQKAFVKNLVGTLQVVAKDVKVQVEFDPKVVSLYRLVGYENRALSKRDFENDQVDAGELGAGHNVTAIYELKFASEAPSFGKLRVRYKAPKGGASQLIEKALPTATVRPRLRDASAPTRLSLAAALIAEKLRGSYWARKASYGMIRGILRELPERNRYSQQVQELMDMVEEAERLDQREDRFEGMMPLAQMNFDHVPALR